MHQLDNKVFDIIDARCNHEDYFLSRCGILQLENRWLLQRIPRKLRDKYFSFNERKLLKYHCSYEQHIHFCALVAIGE